MFLLDIPPLPYADPWDKPREMRLKCLAKGDARIVYYYEKPDTSTFRYRVYNMIQALENSRNHVSAAYFCQDDIASLDKAMDMTDVLVICRSRYTEQLDRLIMHAHNRGKQVFFDIDDLVFDTSYAPLVLNTLDQDLDDPNAWDFWFAYMGRLGATMKLCDKVITTNQYLASRVESFCGKPVHVIPNFLNREQMEVSARILDAKRRGFRRTDRIHLGYFSGTPSHNRDFEVISDSLFKLMTEDPRVVLRVVGFMNIRGTPKHLKSRIERYPLQNFRNLQRLTAEVELNLVPLQDNEFTNCKSELKYFEAGIVGTVSIASPVFTYRNAIEDGVNGYLSNSHEWYERVRFAASNLDKIYPSIAENACAGSERQYAWYRQTALIEDILLSHG